MGRDAKDIVLIWVRRQQKYFCKRGWTRGSENCPSGKSVDGKKPFSSLRNASPSFLRNGFAVIAGGARPCARLEGWPQRTDSPPSFETPAEFIIGPRFARTRWQTPPAITAEPLRGDEVRFQNASSDMITTTDQMTAAQSADQIVVVNKRTGRNESKLRVFSRRPGWTLANANAFHVAYSGQPNTALVAFTSTILIKWAPAIPRSRPYPMQPTSRKAGERGAVAAQPWRIGCG
jgi:hypothetical protein